VKFIPHMLNQVGLKVHKHQSISQMHLSLKNTCETSQCLVVDMWSNDGSDSVIVLIIAATSLVLDAHVVQDNVSTHNQPKSVLRVRPANDG
jgi:hypothetical protein